MEWRCEWCGKPHEEDDPPCDNCGHHKFEKAVVQRPDTEGPASTTVWVCTECGRGHTKNSPPCSRCGNPDLEREQRQVDESNLTDGPDSASGPTGDSANDATGPESTTVWVCTECGREHPKNSPPCSRCGAATLEREQKCVDADELSSPGYLDVLTPRYAAGIALALVLVAVFVLGFTGAADIPGFPSDDGVPTVEDVPGNETRSQGVSLSAVERTYVEELNDRRAAADIDPLDRTGGLDEIATFYNKRAVKRALGNGNLPSENTMNDLVSAECGERASAGAVSLAQGEDNATTLGQRFAEEFGGTVADLELVGVDVHAVDGQLFLSRVVCV
jgi:rubrerythrin